MMKSFAELSEIEQDTAMDKLYQHVLTELVEGRKTPIDGLPAEKYSLFRSSFGWGLQGQLKAKIERTPIFQEWIAEIAGTLAKDAYYIPDDGSMVVRI